MSGRHKAAERWLPGGSQMCVGTWGGWQVEPSHISIGPNKAWGALAVEKLMQMRKAQGRNCSETWCCIICV